MDASTLPEIGFVRLRQIIGDRKAGVPPVIPVGKSTWWEGVKSGRFPAPLRLGPRLPVWDVADIRALIERLRRESNGVDGLTRECGPASNATGQEAATEAGA